MNIKIVYVLVSNETDFYYEMFFLSLCSLRRYNPQADVIVVMDVTTHRRLQDKKVFSTSDVTSLTVPIPEAYNTMQFSRYIKTTLRNYISGTFLYLDVDTIVCGRLDDIDLLEMDLAFSLHGGKHRLHPPKSIALRKQAGFIDLDKEPNYNGGVMFAKETPSTKLFFETWHQRWLQSGSNGVWRDQPALQQANKDMNHIITELPRIWNFHPDAAGFWLRGTKILHFYLSVRINIAFKKTFQHIRDTDQLNVIGKLIIRYPALYVRIIQIRRLFLRKH